MAKRVTKAVAVINGDVKGVIHFTQAVSTAPLPHCPNLYNRFDAINGGALFVIALVVNFGRL